MATGIATRLQNPGLYQCLCRIADGADNVIVVRAGQAINWSIVNRPVKQDGQRGVVPSRKVRYSGEEFRINCPFCGDTRKRLLINHRFGTKDCEIGNRQCLWLAQCLNETRCLDDYENQRDLYNRIFKTFGRYRRAIQLADAPEVEEQVGPVNPPGEVILLEELAKRKPDHAALTYLQSRNYDPIALSRLYGLGFTYKCRDRFANNRIYIPVVENDELCGWQCRYVGDDVNGVSFKDAGIPKYFTKPGYRKTDHVYNFENAIECPTAVLVEGALDVYGFGQQAIGTFGCLLSHSQAELIAKCWKKRHGRDARIVILYDPEPDRPKRIKKAKVSESVQRPYVHQIERARQRLAEYMNEDQILPVYLPGGDPGSLDPRLQRRLIRKAAEAAGMDGLVLWKPDPVKLV